MTSDSTRFRRLPGLPLLGALIVVGMGIPAYLKWMVPRLEARRVQILADAPSEPEGRLARWFEFGHPRIHEALVAARFSAERPWLVSHVVAPADPSGDPEVWGIDFSDLSQDVIRHDGLAVRIAFDAPSVLAHEALRGDNALGVPVFGTGVEHPDPRQLAKERLEFTLQRVREGLAKDIPEGRLSIEVGGLKDPEPPRAELKAPPE
ncbi:MAG: hypothetical protein GY711_09920 [bacterium]|nr:hypothetical protein [bacterium]